MSKPVADIERRTLAQPLEARDTDAGAAQIAGYAAVFNQETVIPGFFEDFREVIEPGAFDEAIPRDDVRALINHDPNLILGRNRAGTLKLATDSTGLRYEIDPPDTSYARDLVTSVKRGDVSQSSFAFRVTEDSWEEPPRGSKELPLRHIRKVELFDVSPVTYPAYQTTTVSARASEMAKTLRDASTSSVVVDLMARVSDSISRVGAEIEQLGLTRQDGSEEMTDEEVRAEWDRYERELVLMELEAA